MSLTRADLELDRMRLELALTPLGPHLLSADELEESLWQILETRDAGEDCWVFGYGSLVWNPLFPFEEKRVVTAYGYHRSFCLWSRVNRGTLAVKRYPLPASSGYANLNTATFDRRGRLWFTGQSGIYGRLDPRSGALRVFRSPGGSGPYGIATTPTGQVWYASLAGSHIARINLETGKATVFRPPTRGQGARRIWPDSHGRLWVSEWNAGRVARYDPRTRRWREWRLPGAAQPYAVYVDDRDIVWLTDFGATAIVRFDPTTQRFTRIRLRANANVRQLLGRPGEVWGAESGADRIVSISR
jgi:virginiamycin B lyase